MEKYSGVKFKTVFLSNNILKTTADTKKLLKWCRVFHEKGFAPCYDKGSCGNLSYRTEKAMIITPSSCFFDKITEKDLVTVLALDLKAKQVFVHGIREPSSETFLHAKIYELREDINAVFHGHCDNIVRNAKKLKLVETEKEQAYGSLKLVEEVEKVLRKNNIIVLKNHGFISLGETMEDAGERILRII
ncbi:class II aldolase/adducin family protein [Candidatus Woesearchaeota archaeon]|nr:class II aldolase/adducin family protein [Candidatus Woesearchaeota archaeon]